MKANHLRIHLRIHLLHWVLHALHSHWHHLWLHRWVLHWVLGHHGRVLHELMLVILSLDFLHLLAFSLIWWGLLIGKRARLHWRKSWVRLLKLHVVGLEGTSLLIGLLLLELIMTQISPNLFVSKRRTVFLVGPNKWVVQHSLVFVAQRLGRSCSFLEQLLSSGCSKRVSVCIHPQFELG